MDENSESFAVLADDQVDEPCCAGGGATCNHDSFDLDLYELEQRKGLDCE